MRVIAVVSLSVLFYSEFLGDDPVYSIADLAWMAGSWYGRYGETVIEEVWTAPEGSNMTGMFRLVKNGSPQFFELMTLEESAEGMTLRIKHFGADLTGWEEKDESETFRLTRREDWRGVFSHRTEDKTLTYIRLPGDSLSIILEEARKGKPDRSEFRFGRLK